MMKNLQIKSSKKRNPKIHKQTFLEHLQELKNRFLVWFLYFIASSFVGYFLYPILLSWLIIPLNKPLYYTSPVGGFEAVFEVSVFFGFIVSIPALLYQVVKFIEPSVNKKPIKSFIGYIIISFTLAIFGMLLAYYLVLPAAFQFLNKFGGDKLSALISTKDYFSFVTKYLLGFALLFQLPLAMYVINKYVKLNPKNLMGQFKYVFLFSFIIAAILTPTPDFINQTIMASPIVVLYLFSVAMIWFISRSTKPIDNL